MLKNVNIGTRLALMGAAALLISLSVVGYLSISRSSAALTASENEQLGTRAVELAHSVDGVFGEEMKLVTALAKTPVLVSAAESALGNRPQPMALRRPAPTSPVWVPIRPSAPITR